MNDYKYSVDFIKNNLQKNNAIINFSPVFGMISGSELAKQILIDRLHVRLNLQLHKILWLQGEPETNKETI